MNTTATSSINATGIDAVHVLVKDFDRALRFYRDTMGLRVAMQSETSAEFELADGNAFGIAHMPEFFIPGGGMMFAVADVATATARLKELGLQIFEETYENDHCISTWALDTEGNYFCLHHRK